MNKMNKELFFCLPSIVTFVKLGNWGEGGYRWGGAAWVGAGLRHIFASWRGDLPSAYRELFYRSVGGPILPKKKRIRELF